MYLKFVLINFLLRIFKSHKATVKLLKWNNKIINEWKEQKNGSGANTN